jgi:cGMP-dependent protein kinase
MGTMQELQEVLSKRDEEIRNLKLVLQQKEIQIQQKEEEIQQLRSHLDQFKSVLPFSGKAHAYPVRRSTIREPCEHEREHEREPRKVRAQGISAEPQDLKSLQDISHQKFNEYPKDER